MPHNPSLTLSPEEMRTLGYQAVDMLVEHLSTLNEQSPVYYNTREAMTARLEQPTPLKGMPLDTLLKHVQQDILKDNSLINHPRFFSYVPSPSNYVAALADFLASGFNIFSGDWKTAPAAAQIEVTTTHWLLDWFGFPRDTSGGLFVSGGSMANMTALAAARHIKLGEDFSKGVIYYSEQTHSSVDKGLATLGFSHSQVRRLPSDAHFCMDPAALTCAIEEDKAKGLRPFCIVANAGTTNTGAVDPIEPLVHIAEVFDMWLHVDAAYGGATILTDTGKQAFKGIDKAHSIAVDPHKWLFQPYEIGCVLVRQHEWLVQTYKMRAEYLRDVTDVPAEINFFDYGVQLTRRFRALKFYMTLKAFGLNNIQAAVQHGLDMAQQTQAFIKERRDWEIVSPATLGILNIRFNPTEKKLDDDALNTMNETLSKQLMAKGDAFLVTTQLKGQVVLRFCFTNPRITFNDITHTIESLESLAKTL